MKKKLFLAGAFLLASFQLVAQNVVKIEKGTPLRKELLALSRPSAEKQFGQSVEFVVNRMEQCGDFAYVLATIQQKGNKPLDKKKVKLEAPYDDNYQTLYKKVKGKWTLVKDSELMGCTDVCWLGWFDDNKYKLPAAIEKSLKPKG